MIRNSKLALVSEISTLWYKIWVVVGRERLTDFRQRMLRFDDIERQDWGVERRWSFGLAIRIEFLASFGRADSCTEVTVEGAGSTRKQESK